MRYGFWLVLVGGILLGACAGTPGRGVPSHYAQDSLRARCLQNPVYCATATGREIASGPVQTVGTAVASSAAVWKVLDDATKLSIQRAMEICADMARTEVLLRHSGTFKSPVPNAGECNSLTVDAQGRSVTWAIRLGLEMHEVALQCAEAKLKEIRPGGFSLKPRYRFNRKTKEKSLISPEEKAALLRQGGEGLLGTLEPDVVIHNGDPLQVQAVFDFKFRCVKFDQPPGWRVYPAGHRYAGKLQGDVYTEAFGPEVHLIGPGKGVFW
jgi:hypothetical protein